MKQIKQKTVMLALSALLLLAAAGYMTFGWFTKMASVGEVEFNVAQWDFSANYTVSDFNLNVYSYSTLNNRLAAPGTSGEIPLILGAKASDTDVEYYITLDKTSMSREFQERIYFYKDAEMTQLITYDEPIIGILERGGSKKITIYWKWIYDYEDIPENITPIETNKEDFDEFDTLVGKNPDLYETQMNATLTIAGAQVSPEPSK